MPNDYNHWTTEEDTYLLEQVAKKTQQKQMAFHLRRTINSVRHQLGVLRRRKKEEHNG